SGSASRPGASSASHRRLKMCWPEAAMLMCPSAVGNTPVGIDVGWSLPAWPGTCRATVQRAAWKSSMEICDCSSEVCTHWASPEISRARSADAHRPLPRQTGDGHEPAHALRDLVEPGPVGVGPVLSEARQRDVDKPRVDGPQRLVVDAEPVLHIGAVVLDQHVGGGRQLLEDSHALRRLEVERQAAL